MSHCKACDAPIIDAKYVDEPLCHNCLKEAYIAAGLFETEDPNEEMSIEELENLEYADWDDIETYFYGEKN